MPSPAALPLPSNSRDGRALCIATPAIVGISSTVSISMRVPPEESGTVRTVAAARNGCKRRMRSDSARARSLQLAPTLRRSSRVIVDALVVVWNTPAARMKGLDRAGKLTNDGATGLISIAVTIVPSHGTAAAQTLGNPMIAAAMARRRAAELTTGTPNAGPTLSALAADRIGLGCIGKDSSAPLENWQSPV